MECYFIPALQLKFINTPKTLMMRVARTFDIDFRLDKSTRNVLTKSSGINIMLKNERYN